MTALLDREDLVGRLFFPSDRQSPVPEGAEDRFVEVAGAQLHVRVHPADGQGVLLLFLGNGENACDWDEAAPSFARHGVRLAVLDYRGYGLSTGVPTMRRLFEDAHVVLGAVRAWFPGAPLGVMGRSLGSAAAWEVAASEGVCAVVIDSGFTDVDAFAVRRGIDPETLAPDERSILDPLPKIARSSAPLLLLHGEEDQAIRVAEAVAALEVRAAPKELVRLPGRGHNDLFAHPAYWRALAAFLRARLGPSANAG